MGKAGQVQGKAKTPLEYAPEHRDSYRDFYISFRYSFMVCFIFVGFVMCWQGHVTLFSTRISGSMPYDKVDHSAFFQMPDDHAVRTAACGELDSLYSAFSFRLKAM